MRAYKVEAESDEFKTTTVVAVPPTWRDVWKILRGRYEPLVEVRRKSTWKGINKALKEVWTDEALIVQLHGDSPLIDTLKDQPAGEYALRREDESDR